MKIFAPVRIPTPGQGISDALNFSPRGNANKLCKFTSRWLVSFRWRIYLDWLSKLSSGGYILFQNNAILFIVL